MDMNLRLVSTRLRQSAHRLLRLCLLAVFVASCAPATATVSPQPLATLAMEATATIPAPTQLPTETVAALPTETLAPTAFPVATSRGPNLEATDPTTVQMASGGLQLVEFFEFW